MARKCGENEVFQEQKLVRTLVRTILCENQFEKQFLSRSLTDLGEIDLNLTGSLVS